MRLAGYTLILVAGIACARRVAVVEAADASAAPASPLPKITTRINRNIERFEEQNRLAKLAQEQHDKEAGISTKGGGIYKMPLKAASQRQFAQIWWPARYQHGQKAVPRIEIDRQVIRCSVDLSGPPEPDTGTDWTEFMTRIDDLAPGRYRIIAPLDEVTLDVP